MLFVKLKGVLQQQLQLSVYVWGDQNMCYEFIGWVIMMCEWVGIVKVLFIMELLVCGGQWCMGVIYVLVLIDGGVGI